jgi:hypothetical protein
LSQCEEDADEEAHVETAAFGRQPAQSAPEAKQESRSEELKAKS